MPWPWTAPIAQREHVSDVAKHILWQLLKPRRPRHDGDTGSCLQARELRGVTKSVLGLLCPRLAGQPAFNGRRGTYGDWSMPDNGPR